MRRLANFTVAGGLSSAMFGRPINGGSMALGQLLSATAHEVMPRQAGGFQGGFVDNLADLEAALRDKSLIDALRNGTPLSFAFEGDSREHAIRSGVMSFAFKTGQDQLDASLDLSARLASTMDGRNKNCLLLLSVHSVESSEAAREVIVWMFPYDRVIQRSGTRVALQDAFSLTSGLRKAASFRGMDVRTGFLSGLALDHQSSNADQRVASFWIKGFLGAELQIQSREGTALAAAAFRSANKSLAGDEPAQEQLVAAIGQLRSRTDRPWTLETIADSLLPAGTARDAFARAEGHGPETRSPFNLALEQFDQKIKYRVFKLDNGITVAAPFVEVGNGVVIEESEGGATLTATGRIQGESIRSTS